MNLSDFLNEQTIYCPIVANTRNSAIQELLNNVQSLGLLSSTMKLYKYIEEFENNQSTAAGKGVAYPHSTSIEIESLTCILGVSKSGLDFNSPDGQPCHIILLSLSPKEDPEKHRKLITLFRSMIADSTIRTSILEAENSTDILNIINDWEEKELLMDDLD